MSLFSDLFNKKKENNEDARQKEFKDKSSEGLDEKQSPSFELKAKENGADHGDASGVDEVEYEVVEREIHPAKIICPDCGGITLEGLDFCDKCGGELQ